MSARILRFRGGLALAGAALCVAAVPPDKPTVQRAIEVPRPGRVTVVLDRDVYEHARPDLGDLRIVDGDDRTVPYLLERVGDEAATVRRRPAILNRGFVRGQSASATLDFGAPVLKRELLLSLSGDNFRRRVVVEGRARQDEPWTTITDTAYVFAVPAASAAGGGDPVARRYETVALPENDQQLLKVTVMRGDDETGDLEIRDVHAGIAAWRRPREVPLGPRVVKTEDAERHETLLTLDLGARHQPFRSISLEVADQRFFRGVTVETRLDPWPRTPQEGPQKIPAPWFGLGECAIYRYEVAGRTVESLRLDLSGRHRTLRLRIHNRDDAPLALGAVSVGVPVERLAFEAVPERRYRLRYGAPALAAPAFDLPRTVGDAARWTATAEEARLEPPVPVAVPAARIPWTERHPALLWGGLLLTVVVLGFVTHRALRAAG